MKYFFSLLSLILSVSFSKADSSKDFVGLLLSDIKSTQKTQNFSEQDYQCITISPAMMEKVIDLMSEKNKNEEDSNTDNNRQIIKKILSHIKSLRIFSAQHNSDTYHEYVITLLNKNKNKYKPYTTADKENTCIWLRKNKDTVIEIIQINKKEDDLKVVNFTGEMTNDFVNELLKM